jgi:hypothetical protein
VGIADNILKKINHSTEPLYICSGADRMAKVPDLRIEAILYNAPALLQGNAAAKNASEIITKNNIPITILDSGGMQIFGVNTGNSKKWKDYDPDGSKQCSIGKTLHLAPEHVGEALSRIPGFSHCMALDDPVLPSNDPFECERNFYKKIQRNVDFAIKTVEIRNDKFQKVKVFMPMQCQSLDHFDIMWERVNTIGLDGVSVPARCFKKTSKLLPIIRRFIDAGIDGMHILGSSRLEIVALIGFLAKKGCFSHLAFDSSTWLAAANNGRVVTPYSLKNIRASDGRYTETIAALMELDPIYSEYGLQNFQLMSQKEQTRQLRTLNYWAISKTKHDIFENSDSVESLCTFLEAQDVHESDISNVHSLLNHMSKMS